MPRRIGVSERPYRGIVEALDKITTGIYEVNTTLDLLKDRMDKNNRLLEIIARYVNKKWFRKHFGLKKK